MEVCDAFDLISHAIVSGSTANGYLVVGDIRGNCSELVGLVLHKIFPSASAQIEQHCHPDVVELEPEGKSRTIHVASVREKLLAPMLVTSFSGGWKVGIVSGVDRMEPAAANAFLKSLEEPTPNTLYLLLTDAPDRVLATIVSRSQRVDLVLPFGGLSGKAYDDIAVIMGANVGNGLVGKMQVGKLLSAVIGELKKSATDEDIAIVRKSFYKTVMSFVRKWMVEGLLPRHQAYRNVEAVEDAVRQSDSYLPDEAVLTFLTDRLVFPSR